MVSPTVGRALETIRGGGAGDPVVIVHWFQEAERGELPPVRPAGVFGKASAGSAEAFDHLGARAGKGGLGVCGEDLDEASVDLESVEGPKVAGRGREATVSRRGCRGCLRAAPSEQHRRDRADVVGLRRARPAGQGPHSRVAGRGCGHVARPVRVPQSQQGPAEVAKVGIVEGTPSCRRCCHDVTAQTKASELSSLGSRPRLASVDGRLTSSSSSWTRRNGVIGWGARRTPSSASTDWPTVKQPAALARSDAETRSLRESVDDPEGQCLGVVGLDQLQRRRTGSPVARRRQRPRRGHPCAAPRSRRSRTSHASTARSRASPRRRARPSAPPPPQEWSAPRPDRPADGCGAWSR